MKHFLPFLAAFFLFALAAGAQKKPAGTPGFNFNIKHGDVLVYAVKADDGSTYHFEVTVKEYKAGINFDFEIPEKDLSGEVSISEAAVKTATKYRNFFAEGALELEDECTVWLSKKNYNELVRGRTVMDMAGVAERFTNKGAASHYFDYKGTRKTLSCIKTNNGSGGADLREIWVLKNAGNPIIVKMNMEFSIELVQVKEVE